MKQLQAKDLQLAVVEKHKPSLERLLSLEEDVEAALLKGETRCRLQLSSSTEALFVLEHFVQGGFHAQLSGTTLAVWLPDPPKEATKGFPYKDLAFGIYLIISGYCAFLCILSLLKKILLGN